MKVDNIQNYSFFIDYYTDVEIKITSTTNNTGSLLVDENGSYIGSGFHAGGNFITPKSNTNGVMLYDDVSFSINDKFLKKKNQNVRYRLGTTKTIITNIDYTTKKLNRNLTNRTVFKVFVNGQEATSYTVDATGVTLTGKSIELLTNINDYVVIIDYPSVQTPSGTVIFEYLAPAKTTPTTSQIDDYLDTLEEVDAFDDFSITKTKQNNAINQLWKYIKDKRFVDKEFRLSFIAYEDYRNKLINKRFRILLYNYTDRVMRVYSNCLYDSSESKTYKRFRNDNTFEIEFEDEYLVTYIDEVAYGDGEYGLVPYGGSFGLTEI